MTLNGVMAICVISPSSVAFGALETTFWSRSLFRSHSNWSWSRPRSHEVLVSYILDSWAQIDQM